MIFNLFFTVLISILFLYINKKISYEHDYPKIFIAINILLSIVTSLKYSGRVGLLVNLLFIVLANITFIDFKYLEIPDTYNFIVLILGILNVVFMGNLSFMITGIISFVLFFMISVFSGGALGGGDIKLSLGLGMFFILSQYLTFIMYTFGVGAILAFGLLLLKKRKKEDQIPFGPFMAIGAVIAVLL